MKKIIIIGVLGFGLYLYLTWKPSASDIARDMVVGDTITYQGQEYRSDWKADADDITGYVRRMDRHFDKNMPIVTYDLILTSGEFNDPDVVSIENKGNGNYYWRAHKKPSGSLVVYHTIPASLEVQEKLDELKQGATISMVGRVSQDNEIQSDTGAFAKLMHRNHKFVLVEDVVNR